MPIRCALVLGLAFAFFGGPASAAEAVTKGLVSYWSFDEGKGTMAQSAVGGKPARLHGPQWVEGVKGTALEFDGQDDYARTELNPALLLGKGDFTIEVWVMTVSLNSLRVVGNQRGGASPGYSVSLCEGKPTGMAMEGARKVQYVEGPTYLADEDWHQIVLVREGDKISLYVDGELDKTTTRKDGPCDISPKDAANEPTWFGMARVRPKPMNAFEGAIDEVRFYNRALTPEEVEQNYDAVLGE